MDESIVIAGRDITLAELVERARLGQFDSVELVEATRLVETYTNRRGVIAAVSLEREYAYIMARSCRRRGEYGLESVYRRRAGLAADVLGLAHSQAREVEKARRDADADLLRALERMEALIG